MRFFTIASIALSILTTVLAMPGKPGYGPAGGQSEIYHQQDNEGYGTYRFGYNVDDPYTYNHQSRHEEKDEHGVVRGHYSLVEPDGNLRTVFYVADKYGFRAFVKNSNKPSSVHGEGAQGPGDYEPKRDPGHLYDRYHKQLDDSETSS